MCRIPVQRASNKALRRGTNALSAAPLLFPTEPVLPDIGWTSGAQDDALLNSLDAELPELLAESPSVEDGSDPLDLFDILGEDEPGKNEGAGLKPEPLVEGSSQDQTVMPAPAFVPMQQFFMYPAELYGFNGMHQPMPAIPPQFLPQNQPVSAALPAQTPTAETALVTAGQTDQSQQGMAAGHSRRHKSAEEIAAQEERVKKRRRESAQRSRARKNCYVKNLEFENKALKAENDKLRALLAQLDGSLRQQPQSSTPPMSFVPQKMAVTEGSLHSAAASH